MPDSNRRRALADVVSVEAWHAALEQGRAKADLHVDVVFGVGRIGGGDPSGVRFRLGLRRAEVIVVVPLHEPAHIGGESVPRETTGQVVGKVETKAKVSKKVGLALDGQGGASVAGVQAKASAEANMALAASKDCTVSASRAYKGLGVTQMNTGEGQRRWIIVPELGETVLSGRPWDAKKAPRGEIKDGRPAGSRSLPGAVRVEVRCLREDLEISNVVLTGGLLGKIGRNRELAAEAAIRTLLSEEGLVAGDMSDPFAELVLVMTFADAV